MSIPRTLQRLVLQSKKPIFSKRDEVRLTAQALLWLATISPENTTTTWPKSRSITRDATKSVSSSPLEDKNKPNVEAVSAEKKNGEAIFLGALRRFCRKDPTILLDLLETGALSNKHSVGRSNETDNDLSSAELWEMPSVRGSAGRQLALLSLCTVRKPPRVPIAISSAEETKSKNHLTAQEVILNKSTDFFLQCTAAIGNERIRINATKPLPADSVALKDAATLILQILQWDTSYETSPTFLQALRSYLEMHLQRFKHSSNDKGSRYRGETQEDIEDLLSILFIVTALPELYQSTLLGAGLDCLASMVRKKATILATRNEGNVEADEKGTHLNTLTVSQSGNICYRLNRIFTSLVSININANDNGSTDIISIVQHDALAEVLRQEIIVSNFVSKADHFSILHLFSFLCLQKQSSNTLATRPNSMGTDHDSGSLSFFSPLSDFLLSMNAPLDSDSIFLLTQSVLQLDRELDRCDWVRTHPPSSSSEKTPTSVPNGKAISDKDTNTKSTNNLSTQNKNHSLMQQEKSNETENQKELIKWEWLEMALMLSSQAREVMSLPEAESDLLRSGVNDRNSVLRLLRFLYSYIELQLCIDKSTEKVEDPKEGAVEHGDSLSAADELAVFILKIKDTLTTANDTKLFYGFISIILKLNASLSVKAAHPEGMTLSEDNMENGSLKDVHGLLGAALTLIQQLAFGVRSLSAKQSFHFLLLLSEYNVQMDQHVCCYLEDQFLRTARGIPPLHFCAALRSMRILRANCLIGEVKSDRSYAEDWGNSFQKSNELLLSFAKDILKDSNSQISVLCVMEMISSLHALTAPYVMSMDGMKISETNEGKENNSVGESPQQENQLFTTLASHLCSRLALTDPESQCRETAEEVEAALGSRILSEFSPSLRDFLTQVKQKGFSERVNLILKEEKPLNDGHKAKIFSCTPQAWLNKHDPASIVVPRTPEEQYCLHIIDQMGELRSYESERLLELAKEYVSRMQAARPDDHKYFFAICAEKVIKEDKLLKQCLDSLVQLQVVPQLSATTLAGILDSLSSLRFIYTRTVQQFIHAVSREQWATMQGAPLVQILNSLERWSLRCSPEAMETISARLIELRLHLTSRQLVEAIRGLLRLHVSAQSEVITALTSRAAALAPTLDEHCLIAIFSAKNSYQLLSNESVAVPLLTATHRKITGSKQRQTIAKKIMKANLPREVLNPLLRKLESSPPLPLAGREKLLRLSD